MKHTSPWASISLTLFITTSTNELLIAKMPKSTHLQPGDLNLWFYLSTYYLCDLIKFVSGGVGGGGRCKLSGQQEEKT